MKGINDKKVKKWIEQNILISLDQLSLADAVVWHNLAEEETWTFVRLAEYALRLRRKRMQLASPVSRREIDAFLLEFRVKVQIVRDRFEELPSVALFDFGGGTLIKSEPFRLAKILYAERGGMA
jgi:hypothetical protein